MRFSDDRPIYEQIAESVAAEVAAGRLGAGARVPSARELAASLEVNPNTAARALQALADLGIARMERGTGYFVAEDGPTRASAERKRRFFGEELPKLFARMEELGIDIDVVRDKWAERVSAEGCGA